MKLVQEELRAAVEASALERLPEVASALWKAYGAGGLTDAEAEELSGLLEARQVAAKAAPVRAITLAAASAKLMAAAAPAFFEKGGAATHAPAAVRLQSRTGSRPRKPESVARRRRLAASNFMPPALAARFTAGEQAVVAVIAFEVGKRGSCALALGHMAALAGVSVTTAKRALRQAKLIGLVSCEERRLSRSRNDTNLVRVVSREWAAWLRTRMPRANHAGLFGPGGQLQPSTGEDCPKIRSVAWSTLGRKPSAWAGSRSMRAARAADA